MKTYRIIKKSIVCMLALCLCQAAAAQDSVTLVRARENFAKGLDEYNIGNYRSSIGYLTISINAVPKAITWYLLGNAYAKSYDYNHALTSVNRALNFAPPLDGQYTDDATKIQEWAKTQIKRQQDAQQPQQGGIKISQEEISVPPKWKTPGQNENPFKRPAMVYIPRQPISERGPGWRFTFPGGGQRNENQSIGDFCCTGETGTVFNSSNMPIGYIYFYDFEGGMNLGNNRSAASKLKILLSGAQDTNDANSTRSIDHIDFSGAELRPGAAKYKTVGALKYKVIILSVEKYSADSFMMDGIRVNVEVSD